MLVLSMLHRTEITVEDDGETITGVCNTIQAEDNSGTSFNVTIGNRACYLKRPIGKGTIKDPIKSHKNVEDLFSSGNLHQLTHTSRS